MQCTQSRTPVLWEQEMAARSEYTVRAIPAPAVTRGRQNVAMEIHKIKKQMAEQPCLR